MAKYENVEDILPLGKKIIRIEPQDRYELYPEDGVVRTTKDGRPMKGHFIKGEQQTRTIKNGRNAGKKFWVFKSPDVIGSNGYPVQINAWDEDQKRLFDKGTVEVNVIAGKDFVLDEEGEPVRGEDGKSIRTKKAFYNPAPEGDVSHETISTQEAEQAFGGSVVEEEIRIEDIPF